MKLPRDEQDPRFLVLRRVLEDAARSPAEPVIPGPVAPAPGEPPPTQPDGSGTMTFLFADVEGSTRRWEEHPEAMARASRRHDAILRDAVAAHGGQLYKTIGDAIQAAFPSAPQALGAAIDAQRSLQAEAWGEIGGLRVRMALHTGLAEPGALSPHAATTQVREGGYAGPLLNRVARLLSAGHGGQVLLSGATSGLVQDALPRGVSLRDLGEYRLRDLLRPEHIFQVLAPDLPGQFPPLKTLDAHPTNLPLQATPFLGREREVEAIGRQIRPPFLAREVLLAVRRRGYLGHAGDSTGREVSATRHDCPGAASGWMGDPSSLRCLCSNGPTSRPHRRLAQRLHKTYARSSSSRRIRGPGGVACRFRGGSSGCSR